MISNRIIPRREQLSRRDSTSTRDATSTAFATFFPSSGKLYHGTGPVERGNGNNIPVSQPFVLRVMLKSESTCQEGKDLLQVVQICRMSVWDSLAFNIISSVDISINLPMFMYID